MVLSTLFNETLIPAGIMRHYQNTNEASCIELSPLHAQVFSILDSRIQFIDFQVQRYFNSCTNNLAQTSSSQIPYHGPTNNHNLVDNFDALLNYTEKLQNDLKLLQILKTWLKEETVQEVLDLLTNNKYLRFSEESLEQQLKEKLTFSFSA